MKSLIKFEYSLELQLLFVQSLKIHTWDENEQHTQYHRCGQEEKQRNIAPHNQQSLDIRFSDPTPVHPRVFTKSEVGSHNVELVLVRDGEIRAYYEGENNL
jgi:hypothetical protein